MRPLRHHEVLHAAALLAAVLVVFLWAPISTIGSAYFSTADISQASPLTRVVDGYTPKNQLASDPAVQMQPWLMLNRDELSAGRIPLWNPFNGNGSPHLANCQSAVFSPFSIPFYVLDFRVALVVAAFLKLFALGFFAFLFLRALKLAWWPSVIAATAFMLSANHIDLLSYPHDAAIVTLPAALWCVELACARMHEHWGSRSPLARFVALPLGGLTLALAAGLLAGQPEITYFNVLSIAAYGVFRLALLWRAHGSDVRAFRRLSFAALAFALSGFLGLCVAAIQVIPFVEYLQHSSLLGARALNSLALSPKNWPLAFFPELLGDPTKPYSVSLGMPQPTFESAAAIFVGAFVLFLAVLSVWRARKAQHLFFLATCLVWALYAYDAFGFARFLESWVPLLQLAPIDHSAHLAVFALCVCAAFVLDRLFSRELPPMGAPMLLSAGVGFVAFFAWGAVRFGPASYPRLRPSDAFLAASSAHKTTMIALFFAALAVTFLLERARGAKLRTALSVALLGLVFASGGGQLTEYNPTIPAATFFPRTPSMVELQQVVGSDRLVVLGEDLLPPDMNIAYGIRMPASYDALWIRPYDELYKNFFGDSESNWRPSTRASPKALDLFGVRYVLARASANLVGEQFAGTRTGIRRRFTVGALRPGREVVQSFTPMRDRLRAIRLFFSLRETGHEGKPTIVVQLEDLDAKRVVFERQVAFDTHGTEPGADVPIEIAFDPIDESRGRHFALRISARESCPMEVWACHGPLTEEKRQMEYGADEPSTFLYAGEEVEGRVLFDCCYDGKHFREVARIGELTLHEHVDGCWQPHIVHDSRRAASAEEARALVCRAAFDPAQEVVIGDDSIAAEERVPTSDDRRAVKVMARNATHQQFLVDALAPGWVVFDTPWYPGWEARVDGRPAQLVRANYAFCALPIQGGRSVVELDYKPSSFRIGRAITLASLALSLLLVGAFHSRFGQSRVTERAALDSSRL